METVLDWIVQYGYAAIFCLLMLGIVGAPFPDDLILAFAGYLVSAGYLKPVPTLVSAFMGSLCGISLSYGLGRILGFPLIVKYGRFVHITANRLNQVNRWYERFGKWGLLFGYFVAGVRHGTAFVAGASKVRLPVFALFAYTGGLLWSITLISTGYVLGEKWASISDHRSYQVLIFAIIVFSLTFAFYLAKKRSKRACEVPATSFPEEHRP